MNKIKKISIITLIAIVLSIPFLTFAETPTRLDAPTGAGTSESSPLIDCGNSPGINTACGAGDFIKLIQDVLALAFTFAGFIVAIMFMYAGFLLITSAGNPGQIQKAKDIFKRVVVGFLIMFLSYVLIKNLLDNVKVVDFFKNIIKN